MPELPNPEEYEDVEDWFAEVFTTDKLDREMMDEIIDTFGQSRWVE